jgi:hypothetical protein
MDTLSHDSFHNLGGDAPTPQRGGSRDSLLLGAQFRAAGAEDSVQVRVRNLSAGGLMAEYVGAIGSGDRIEIEVRGIGWVPGEVAWSTNGRIGIAFDREIDPLRARKPVAGGRKGAAPGY